MKAAFISYWYVGGLLLLLIVAAGMLLPASLSWETQEGTDIYYNWVEGKKILTGENPYARILSSDMRVNDKYPTYFPLIYQLSSLSQQFGLRDYESWLAFWRIVLIAFYTATGCLIYYILYRHSGLLAAALGALLWFFNRWILHSLQAVNYDAIPIFFLMLSLWLLARHRWSALLLFSLSLALKQLDALLVPLYLIWIWQAADAHGPPGLPERSRSLKALAGGALAIFSIPLLVSLPFFFWPGLSVLANTQAFLRSMVFEVTRVSLGHLATPSLDTFVGLSGPAARLPAFTLLLLVYGLFWQRKIGIYTASLLAMTVFMDFNPIFFLQYFSWLVPFVPLVILEVAPVARNAIRPLPAGRE